MNRIRPRSRVVFRIFLSYLLVFAVPFVVFAVFVYYNAVVSLRHGIEAANLDKLNQVRDTFDLMESSLEQTAARISIDPRLTPYMVRSGSYQTIEAIEELAKYKANNALAEEVLLYFRGDSDIYSSKGKNSLGTFASAVYGFSDWNNSSLYRDLNEPTSLHIRPAEPVAAGNEQANMLTYLVPIPRNSPSPYATVMFIIRESVFTDRIKQLLGDFKGAVYVLDEKGNALASRSAGSRLGKEETVEALRNHADPGIQGTTIGREKYSVMVAKSAITGWSYAAVMPTDQFMGRVLKMKTLVLLLCALVTGVGLAAAVLLTRLQYRPIRGIVEHIRSTLGGPAQPAGARDEWTMIRETVDANADLQQRIAHLRPVAQEQFFLRLLMGHAGSADTAEAFMSREGIALGGNAHFAALVKWGAKEYVSSHQREEALRTLSAAALPSGAQPSIFGVELIHENAIALVVSLTAETDSREVRQLQQRIAEEMARHIERISRSKPTIGVGNPVAGLPDINRSYIEAMAAVDYRLQSREGNIIFFDEIAALQEESDGWYPIEEQVRLVQSIKQGDSEMAGAAMAAILRDLSGKEISVFYLKCMCYDLINTVLRTMNELRIELPLASRRAMAEFVTPEELGAAMNELLGELCDRVRASKESKNTALRDDILAYIRDHFREYDIGLEKIADQFQISISYFSRFLKDQTGLTFTELLTNMRMEEVKQELRGTDKAIKDIVTGVGYIDVPNFMRKFKKAEGITLGQYRQLYANMNDKAL